MKHITKYCHWEGAFMFPHETVLRLWFDENDLRIFCCSRCHVHAMRLLAWRAARGNHPGRSIQGGYIFPLDISGGRSVKDGLKFVMAIIRETMK